MGGADVGNLSGASSREGGAPGMVGGDEKSSSVSGTALMEAIELTTNGEYTCTLHVFCMSACTNVHVLRVQMYVEEFYLQFRNFASQIVQVMCISPSICRVEATPEF